MKAQNKAGTWFALTEKANGNFLVHKLCSNHSSNFCAGISKTWRFVQPRQRMTNFELQEMAREGMEKAAALELFGKRLKGTQR